MGVTWIKLSVNMFDDEKIKLIRTMPEGEAITLIWVQLLCLAGKINDGGAVYMGQNLAYTDEMLATILGHPVNTMRAAIQAFEQFKMIEVNTNGMIEIANWEKHQNVEAMEEMRAKDNARQKKVRLRKKIKALGYDPDAPEVPKELPLLEEYVSQLNNVTKQVISCIYTGVHILSIYTYPKHTIQVIHTGKGDHHAGDRASNR